MEDKKPWEMTAEELNQSQTIDSSGTPTSLPESTDTKNPWEATASEIQMYGKPPEENYGEMSALDVAGSAITNFPASLAGVASDIYTAITNPSDTLYGLGQLIVGAAQKGGLNLAESLMPESMEGDVSKEALQGKADVMKFLRQDGEALQSAEAVANFYAKRYGSVAGLKEAVANDPASVMADAATVLTAGAGGGTKLGLPAKATSAMTKTASYVDPVTLVGKGVATAGSGTSAAAKFITGTASGAGADAVSQAYKSGAAGGKSAEAFAGAMRGNIPILTILKEAKEALLNMKMAKNAKYRENQAALAVNDKILNFNGIDKAVTKALNMVTYKGKIINEAGHTAVLKAQELVNNWKASDPKKYHTPVDIDQLKQQVYSIVEKQEYGSQARLAVNQIRNGIDKEIKAQAPSYASMMKDYASQASLVEQLEKAFKLGDKANIESAVRSLQQSVRDNVNTGFGMKKQLADNLDSAGGSNVVPMAAGSSLSNFMPRGIQGATALPTAFVANSVGGIPLMMANVAASSPRFVGEAAFKAGQLSRATQGLLGMAPDVNVGQALNLVYQSQQPKEQQ